MDEKRIYKEIKIFIRFLKEKHFFKQWIEKANGNRKLNYCLITNINSMAKRLINNNDMNIIYNTDLVTNIVKLRIMFLGATAFNEWYGHPYVLGKDAQTEFKLWKAVDSSYANYREKRKKLFALWTQKK